MKLLLKNVRAPIARVLNTKIADPRVLEYINEALEFMTVTNDWANMQRVMSFTAYNGMITFPPEVVIPLKFNIGASSNIGQPYGKHYEYVLGGPGLGEDWCYTGRNMFDVGEVPTTYDIPKTAPAKLALWSDQLEAYPFRVHVRGLDETGHEVMGADGSLGETIVWQVDDQGTNPSQIQLSERTYSKIIQVVKPVSNGYLNLSTASEDGVPLNVLSHFHPFETVPSYRRFQILGIPSMDNDGYTLIKGLFRIRHTPVYDDNDSLCVNLITALKLAVKALLHYDHDEVNSAATLEGIVERMLMNQVNQEEVDDNIIDTEEGYGMGDVQSL